MFVSKILILVSEDFKTQEHTQAVKLERRLGLKIEEVNPLPTPEIATNCRQRCLSNGLFEVKIDSWHFLITQYFLDMLKVPIRLEEANQFTVSAKTWTVTQKKPRNLVTACCLL